jgi:exopolysaccharide biosynthesis polyprenyl glycosylphosphotransferase
MFSRHNRIIGALYLLVDTMLALASFALAHWIRARMVVPRPLYPLSNYVWIVPLAVGLWAAVGIFTGIYREIREEDLSRAFRDPLQVALLSTILLFAVTFAFKLEYISRLLLGFYAAADLVLMIAWRLIGRSLSGPLRRHLAGVRHFLLIGTGPEAVEIARLIEANANRGLRLFGFVRIEPGGGTPEGGSEAESAQYPGLGASYPVYALSQVSELLKRQVIDEVVFAVAKDELEKLEETFLLCEEEGVKTRLSLTFFPHVISKVHLDRLQELPLLTFSTTPINEDLLLLKRVSDFLVSLAALIFLSPFFLLLAILIKLTSKGPVLFRQTRCGLGGRKFTVFKFRSMQADADLRRDELAALNELDGPAFKMKNDPRCTAVGRFMRKFSLDELPQLLNVLIGDMSLVGPRPPLPEEVERYERWQRRRLRMPPGLTCLWALEGRNQLSFRRWMQLDLEYIDHWSPMLDLKILLRTIPIVFLGRGAS